MAEMNAETLTTIIIIAVSGIGILASTITLAIVEGRAVLKALEGMTRQPESARDLRGTLTTGMALLETSAIYVLLVIILLIQLLNRFSPGG
jgi:F-type H+-transporting ATPase subunit c